MIKLPGSTPVASAYTSERSPAGSIILPVPFIFSGEISLINCLSVKDSIQIPAVHSECGSTQITNKLTERITDNIDINLSLSGMNSKTAVYQFISSVSLSESTGIVNLISETRAGSLLISTTTGDFGISSSMNIRTPLQRTAMSGSTLINLPNSSARVVRENLQVLCDGRDSTSKLLKASIKLFGKNNRTSAEAEFKNLPDIPDEFHININEESYLFETEQATSKASTTLLNGTLKIEDTVRGYSGAKKASDVSAESGIIFAADDFVVNLQGELTALQAAKTIADNSGSLVRTLPSGDIVIIDGREVTYEPSEIISMEMTKTRNKIACVEVVYGKTGDDYVTLEPEIRSTHPNNSILVRVYGTAQAPEISRGGIQKVSSGREEITEDVIFTQGRGRLSKPAQSVFTNDITFDGKNVYTNRNCIFLTISYSTCYELYEISLNGSGEISLCLFLKNRAALFTGSGRGHKTILSPGIFDHVTAVRCARSLLKKTGSKIRLKTPHSNIINTPSPILLKTPAGSGSLLSAEISIENSPLKITDILEGAQWQK